MNYIEDLSLERSSNENLFYVSPDAFDETISESINKIYRGEFDSRLYDGPHTIIFEILRETRR